MKYKVLYTNKYGNSVKPVDGLLLLNTDDEDAEHYFNTYDEAKCAAEIFLHKFPQHEVMIFKDDEGDFEIIYGESEQ